MRTASSGFIGARGRGVWAALLSIAVIAAALVVPATAASAAEGDPEYLTVTKSVAPAQVSPGQPFTYTIAVNCSEQSCLDAALRDALPAELDGYQLQNVSMQPGAVAVPRDVTWTVDGVATTTAPAIVTANTVLDVDFTGVTSAPVGTGLQNGQTFTVTLTLQVPDDLLPGEQTITNYAHTEATNSAPGVDDAIITVVTPEIIDVAVEKSWGPSPQSFNPGSPSSIALTLTNASNGPVEKLVLQEPASAVDDATALDASNPFTITDFTGFDAASMPAGAEQVQVDLYLEQDGVWAWAAGTPAATPALPLDVDPADVGGIRLTYTGTAIAESAAASVVLGAAQRATHRNTDADLSTAQHRVENVVQGTAGVQGRDEVSATDTAEYRVIPSTIAAATTKSINPNRIAAGDSTLARIVGTNTSDVGVNELRVSDRDFFTDTIRFGGFTTAPVWPQNAESGAVTYYPLDGGDAITVPLVQGAAPAGPGELISGFEIVFTATGGAIQSSANTVLDFAIETTESAIDTGTSLELTNSATTSVRAQNGLSDQATDTADLTLLKPAIEVVLEKTIRPSAPVAPGEAVVTELEAHLTTTSDYITPRQIVVEDAFTTAGGFWDAFDLTSIAPTQVPRDATLTIEIQDDDGVWHELKVFAAQGSPHLVEMSGAEIESALPAGVDISDVRGIRFTFDSVAAAGFPADTTVTPYVVSEARSTLRTGGDVVPGADEPVEYVNAAGVTGSGVTGGGTQLSDAHSAEGTATIETAAGRGPMGIDKRWSQPTVSAQSGQTRSTSLDWRVAPRFSEVVITDPATSGPAGSGTGIPGDVSTTVYDAFDLVQVAPIAADVAPYSNGWYLKYDNIDAVELYMNGAWQPMAAPQAGWIQQGAFVGYTLSDQQRADALGVRLRLSPNTQARAAAAAAGDPWVTALAEGVGSSSTLRTFSLSWQIRDQKRSDSSWVTDSASFNTDDAGVVDNTVRIDGTRPSETTEYTASGHDRITITNPGPGVEVAKSANPSAPLYVPRAGTAASSFPTTQFTITANNESVSKASYVRVTDPPACADGDAMPLCQSAATSAGAVADPFTADIEWLTAPGQGNPFERFDLKTLTISASIPGQVDLAASAVWLLRYSGGDYTTVQTTAAAANAMTAAELADVVGVSVTFQGTDPVVGGGTITADNDLRIVMDAQLRTTLRSSGDDQTAGANETIGVSNRVFAQSYDPILSPGTQTGSHASATVVLTGGDLNVGPFKSIAPSALTEPTRDTAVTVTLGADQGANPVSTLAPAEVRLTDDVQTSPEFWDAFDFTGLGAITAPAGADRVAVSVYGPFGADDARAWVSSDATAIAAATVPVASDRFAEVEGIRFVFSRADGAFFSASIPAPHWSTTAAFTVQLREDHRDSGDPVELAGTIDNTVLAISDRKNGEASAEKAQSAVIALSPGTFRLAVNKKVNDGTSHFATAGDLVPWDLSFTNAGTGYLTIEELRDLLPAHLLYLGDEPIYTPASGGVLPEPDTMEQVGSELVFTWPEGSRMAPGETFSLRVMLELQPGLGANERATNEMTVHTTETLQACTNSASGGSVTGAWDADPTTCGTTEYVAPTNATSLFVVKGVRGEREGAINPNNLAQVCQQNLQATGGSYFRSPCAANSEIGGTDSWVLRAQNGGTSEIAEMVLFDQLPVAGDRSLISGGSRGSAYRPQMLDDLALAAPAGTTIRTEVTASADVCAGTWSNLVNQVPCAQNGEVWVEVDADTDWTQVSGLRLSLDFRTTDAGALLPGEFVDATYSTENVVASASYPGGAPAAAPSADAFAWNQFGVKYRDDGVAAFRRIAPSPVGVHLVVGALQIDKEIAGAAAAYAPDAFRVDVVCTIDEVTLDMGADAVVTLDTANGFSRRIDGIPFGASCTITEQGATGEFGEASRTGSPTVITISDATGPADQVLADDIATIVNTYSYSGLSVTKIVDTDAVAGRFGPFEFTLACTSASGIPVVFPGGATQVEFTLNDGDVYQAPANTIPARSTCQITEVEAAAADSITVTGTGVTDLGDGAADIEVGVMAAAATFTNSFDTGVLTVEKIVDGEGAALYGDGPFTFTAVCTYRGQEIVNTVFELEPNSRRTLGPYPMTTSCIVDETHTAGATDAALLPADGTVTIGDRANPEWTVIATNTFDLTSIEVTKTRAGDLDADGADGSFTVELVCVLPVDGTERAIAIPGGAVRVLSAEGGYVAEYASLPVNARCDIEETDAGTAVRTTISVTTSSADVQTTTGASASIDLAGAVTPTEIEITNSFVKALPQTGLAASALAWLMVLLLGGAGIALVLANRRRDEMSRR